MPRIRTIKPRFFESLTTTSLTYRQRLLFIGLWTFVDDSGRGFDEPRLIKAAIWPLDDDVGPSDVADDLAALQTRGLIERWYEPTLNRDLLRVRSFLEHQRVNRATASDLPPSPEEAHGALTEPTLSAHQGKGREQGREGERKVPAPNSSLADLLAGKVTRSPHEAIVLAESLAERHGEALIRSAIERLPSHAFTFTSELRAAMESAIADVVRARPPCPDCADSPGTIESSNGDGRVRCPRCGGRGVEPLVAAAS